MNKSLIASAALALTLSLGTIASASTISVGTSTSLGTTSINGCLSQSSWSDSVTHQNSLAVSGSAQLVGAVAVDGSLSNNSLYGAGQGLLQGDASLNVTQTSEVTHSGASSHFQGSESSTEVDTGSAATISVSP